MTTRTECRVCDGPIVAEIAKVMCDQIATKLIPVQEAPYVTDADIGEVFCADCGIVYRYESK